MLDRDRFRAAGAAAAAAAGTAVNATGAAAAATGTAAAAGSHSGSPPSTYGPDELVNAGHKFFGNVSRGLASVIERAVSQWGLPNGYVLGEEGSGAFVAGLRYGEGTLYTKNAGDLRVYWQGPSVGFDWGGDGARTMTLVYNLPATNAIYQRFVGIDGSAYIIGGFGMTALTANNIVLVPIRSGIGLRLGANIGYLKFTPSRDLEPVLTLLPGASTSSGYGFTLTRQCAGLFPVPHGIVKDRIFSQGYPYDRADHVSGDRFSDLDVVRADDRAAGS